MHSVLGFSGRAGRGPYGILTLAFAAVVFGLAANQSSAPFTQLVTAPWTVIGRSLDRLIHIGGDRASAADTFVSLAVIVLLIWVFSVLTARRLRDIGQSPWWTALVIFSGLVVPAMIVLSLVPSASPAERDRSSRLRPVGIPAD